MVARFKPSNGNGHNGHHNGKSNGHAIMGRPSKYQPAFVRQAEKFCKLGATDAELADLFEVTTPTIHLWKLIHSDFFNAIKTGKDPADDKVERAFYQKATGYWVDTEKLFVLKDETFDKNGNLIGTRQYIHHEPTREWRDPDTAAGFIWLKNRRPDQWRDKHEINATVRNEHIFTFNIFENDLSSKVIEGKKQQRLERRP